MRIDLLDRKILFELDKNSRLSYQQIGKKVRASKEVVMYRTQRLIKQNVICNFHTIISLATIGYFNHKIYYQLHGLTEEKEKIIINKLKQNKNVIWIAICEGRWDLMISFYAKNIQDFALMKAEVFEILAYHIQEYAIIINEDGFIRHRNYLCQNKDNARNLISYLGKAGNLVLDERERKLLKTLAMNARLPIYELAKMSGYSTKTVVEKIRAFVKSGLIQSFTIGLNVNAIDHFTFKIFIYFNDVSKKSYSSVFNFCKELIQVRYITETIGSWELELGLETPEPRDLQMIIKTLKNRFSHEIKQIDSVTILDEVKLEFFP